jgi:tetratricopeptide (TPR) repeat protein
MRTFQAIFPRLLSALLFTLVAGGCSREGNKSTLLDRANNYFKAGEYDSARIEYLNLLRLDPQNATAIERLGTIWFEDGAPLRALPFLAKSRELAPNNLNCRTKLAKALMAVGDVPNARKEAIAILDRDPANDDTIILLADTALTPQEVADTEKRLQNFSGRDKALLDLASASLSTRKGDLAGAEEAVRRALDRNGKLASAHLTMAGLMLLRGNPAEVARELQAAGELAPVRSTPRLKYAEFKANHGAQAQAAAMLKEMTRQAPDFLPAWELLARMAYRQTKYDESLALLENIFNRDPLNLEGRLLESDVNLAKGEVRLALEGLKRVDRVYPHVPIIKCQLARAYLHDDDPTQAIVALNQALARNPDYKDAILLLGQANLRMGAPQPVIASMQSFLKKHPEAMQARVVLAAAYRSAGDLDGAAATFRDQINSSPRSAQPYLGLGLILREQDRMTEARQAFEKAHDLEPGNAEPVQRLVELDIANRDFTSAFQEVKRQFKTTSGSADAEFLEGKIYLAQGDFDRAEVSLLKALELDPTNRDAYDLLIYTYLGANRLGDALSRLNNLFSKQPDNVRLLMLSGLIYEKMNRFADARDAYEKLLSLKADFEAALNNLACLYADRLNQLDKAYDLARKAWALEPGAAAIADTLGWILYKRADYERALALLKESAAKLPNNPEVQVHLGVAFYMMGQMDAARAALRRAVDVPSEFPGKQDALRRLAVLGKDSSALETPPIEKLESALKEQPDDVVVRLLLGDAYAKQGEFAHAAEAYEEAVKINHQLLPGFIRLQNLYAGPLGNKGKATEFATRVRELAPDGPQAASPSAVGNF